MIKIVLYVVTLFSIFFRSLMTLHTIVREIAGEGSVAVTVGVSDR